MIPVLMVAGVLILGHELAHIVTTVLCGGRFQGLVCKGLADGVKLAVTLLSVRQRIGTAWAGMATEVILAGLPAGGAFLCLWPVTAALWAVALAAFDLLLNLGPWWAHNDGARIRAWRQALALERAS
jgi:hypothetical protein